MSKTISSPARPWLIITKYFSKLIFEAIVFPYFFPFIYFNITKFTESGESKGPWDVVNLEPQLTDSDRSEKRQRSQMDIW